MTAPRPRLRLMPVVMAAAGALLMLKAIGLSTSTSYLFVPPAAAAGAGLGAAEAKPAVPDDHGAKEATPAKPRPVEKPPVDGAGELAVEDSAQRALLEALTKRRDAIEAKSADLDLRENLLMAAEKRIDERLGELKRLEATIGAADKRRADEEAGKLKELVTLYESMKPKEAARIFDKLDGQVLLDVASRMKPRTLSVVLGLMAPEAAQKLTVALARREVAQPVAATMAEATSELPKIEGRPSR